MCAIDSVGHILRNDHATISTCGDCIPRQLDAFGELNSLNVLRSSRCVKSDEGTDLRTGLSVVALSVEGHSHIGIATSHLVDKHLDVARLAVLKHLVAHSVAVYHQLLEVGSQLRAVQALVGSGDGDHSLVKSVRIGLHADAWCLGRSGCELLLDAEVIEVDSIHVSIADVVDSHIVQSISLDRERTLIVLQSACNQIGGGNNGSGQALDSGLSAYNHLEALRI